MPETTVVLATYNGEKYIAEFMASLVAQSYRDFDIMVSDDCSTDRTTSIIESFQSELSISILRNFENVGPSLNFCRAINMAAGQFVAFADQDDHWHPDKLFLMVNLMKTFESSVPRLVFCDLEIVDENLDRISALFFSDKKSSTCGHIEDFIISNHIPGCAMLINRSLLKLGMPVPSLFKMHDWWFAIIAAAFGAITFLDRPLVRYRQHANNAIGVQTKIERKKFAARMRWLLTAPQAVLASRIKPVQAQAKTINHNVAAFYERFGDSLGDRERNTMRAFQNKRFIFSRLRILAGAKRGESKINALLMSIFV
jgi:glycosyltransferase involved in cell wall biosynthesis